jgi:hypothetical protein
MRRATIGTQRERHAPRRRGRGRGRHPRDHRVIQVDHRHRCVFKDPGLGRSVGIDIGVTIQVIWRYVQDRRGCKAQRPGRLQLVAGKFQHIQICRRPLQQVQGRRGEVSAGAGHAPGLLRHARDQCGDGALAIGAGNTHHRTRATAREQFDIADHRLAQMTGSDKERVGQRQAR